MLAQPTKPVSHDPGFDFSMVKLKPWREKIVADLAPLKFFRRGGGTSGRAMAFCLGRSGSNPGTDLGFLSVQNCCQSMCRAFSINVK